MPLDIFGGRGKYGDLDLNRYKIINCLDPTEDHHVSTKQYVDTNFVTKSDCKMDGNLNMDGNSIINSRSPTNANDLTTKEYVDNNFVTRSG